MVLFAKVTNLVGQDRKLRIVGDIFSIQSRESLALRSPFLEGFEAFEQSLTATSDGSVPPEIGMVACSNHLRRLACPLLRSLVLTPKYLCKNKE